MIKLLQNEYDAWAGILQKYNEKRVKRKEKLDEESDALFVKYSGKPSADGLTDEIPAELYNDYKKANNRLLNKYESDLIELDRQQDGEQYPIIQAGIDRAIKGKTPKALYEDAKATVLCHAYEEMTDDEGTGAYALFGGVLRGSVDLNVSDHILVLRDAGAKEYAEELDDLVERYTAGQITRTEAEPYKGFEYIEIVIPVKKDSTLESLTVDIKKIETASTNVTANADLVKKIFDNAIEPINSVLKITDHRGTKNAKTREVKVAAAINYDGLNSVTILNRDNTMGLFDRMVFDAVVSLYDAGNQCMTLDMIANAMRGYSLTDSASDAQREAIDKSISKLSSTRVLVDTSSAIYDYPELKTITRESNILNTDKVTVNYRNNTWKTAIRVNQTPLLLLYAQSVNQVVRNDIKLLACPVRGTQENILLQGYLYNRVLGASGRSHYNTILVDSILQELNITQDTCTSAATYRNKKKKIIDNAIKILDYWTQEGFIKGYDLGTEKKGKHESIIKFVLQ